MRYFGLQLKAKGGGLKLTRENYINVRPFDLEWETKQLQVTVEYLHRLEEMGHNNLLELYLSLYSEFLNLNDPIDRVGLRMHYAMENFDLSMRYFDAIDRVSFEQDLDCFVEATGFNAVYDLNKVSAVAGYYLMVLDEYKQVYVGSSKDIKKRILQHWAKVLPLHKISDGRVNERTVPAIGSFRAFDTSRIYAIERDKDFAETLDFIVGEYELINKVPFDYCLNRDVGINRPRYRYKGDSFERIHKELSRFSNKLGIPKSLELKEFEIKKIQTIRL